MLYWYSLALLIGFLPVPLTSEISNDNAEREKKNPRHEIFHVVGFVDTFEHDSSLFKLQQYYSGET